MTGYTSWASLRRDDVSRETLGNVTDWRGVAQGKYPEAIEELDAYVELLRTLGVERGLIGPRETDRIWERHILNCAAVADDRELVPQGATVVDVGTGAGLPGFVWAVVRPDLRVTLVESMKRRVDFLNLVVDELSLGDRVQVFRGRAEDLAGSVSGRVVTARAVAPMSRLVGWLTPLAEPGGELVVLKGRNVAEELAEAAPEMAAIEAGSVQVHVCGEAWLEEPTMVVQIADFKPGRGGKSRGSGHRRR